MDPRSDARLGGVDETRELTYLRAGMEPPWEVPHRGGRDVRLEPELQTEYQRTRWLEFLERVEHYRAEGLL
jgi:hypothetical protein